MIDKIFWALMNGIASIVKFIIVFGMLGFIFILPFLLKGGWILGLILYGWLGISAVTFLIDKHNSNKKDFENRLKERE